MEKSQCPKCKGETMIQVWNGSIHDPRDPEWINCTFCSGRGLAKTCGKHKWKFKKGK